MTANPLKIDLLYTKINNMASIFKVAVKIILPQICQISAA
jgi:hypothetical protein